MDLLVLCMTLNRGKAVFVQLSDTHFSTAADRNFAIAS
jgi:hypothetical protein